MAAKPEGKRRILVLCTDGSLHSDVAFKYYCTDVRKTGDYLVMLFSPQMDLQQGEQLMKDADGVKKLAQHVIEEGNRAINDAKILEKSLKDNMIDGKVVVVSASNAIPAKESILEASVNERADMIILGARRLGRGLRMDGSTKQYIVRMAKVPVLICKRKDAATKSREGVKRLVLAGSDCQLQASEGLKAYRKHIYREGDYMLLTYVPSTRPGAAAMNRSGPKAITASTGPRLQEELQQLYADNASLLQDFIKHELKMPGEVIIGEPDSNPGDTLLEVAGREGVDLIVIGARGLGEQAFEASYRTSDKIANDSEVTVFVNKY